MPMVNPSCYSSLKRAAFTVALPLLIALPAQAVTSTFNVYLDTDNASATGCTVTTANGTAQGMDKALQTVVVSDTSGVRVTGISVQTCSAGSFGAPTVVSNTATPLQVGQAASGSSAIETFVPVSMIPSTASTMRMVVTAVGSDGLTGSDALTGAAGAPISFAGPGGPAVAAGNAVPVPTMPFVALMLTAGLMLAAFAYARRRGWTQVNAVVTVLLTVAVSTQLIAAIVRDGLITDWAGITALATDPKGDAPAGVDITAVYTTVEGANRFFRIDAVANTPPTATAQSVNATAGTAAAIVLAGSDPENAALTYAIATQPTKGSLTGTPPNVSYTANAASSGSDSFTFTVNDGAFTSAPATVSINITAVTPPAQASRPQLTSTQAAPVTVNEVLKTSGTIGSLVTTDAWDPLADTVITGTTAPTFQYSVSPSATPSATAFKTVQAAVNQAVTDIAANTQTAARVYISVAPGTYNEVVYVPTTAKPITLWGTGTSPQATRIHYAIDQGMPSNGASTEYPTKLGPIYNAAGVHASVKAIYDSCNNKATIGTTCSAVMWVKSNGFQVKNLTVENSYDERRGGTGLPNQSTGNHQAVAFETDGVDKVHVENVRLIGNQDTAYFKSSATNRVQRVFVNNSYVEGDVDFIFGRATVYFRKSEIKSVAAVRGSSSIYVTAASTNYNNPYGFVFDDCDFTSDGAGINATAGAYLGRQWYEGATCSPYGASGATCAIDATNAATASATLVRLGSVEAVGKVLILRSRIGGHIRPTTPWADWNTTTSSTAYRLVQYNSDQYWNNLDTAGKTPATLYPSGKKTPVEPFLAEFENNVGPDSAPISSLGANGFATTSGTVTGGFGATAAKTYTVTNRQQLIAALYNGGTQPYNADGSLRMPDHDKKIIYVSGTIDLNVNDSNVAMTEKDYMDLCAYTTHSSFADFFTAYKTAYDPNTWNSQSLDTADSKPPAPSGALETARQCFAKQQAKRIVLRVGANTSLIGVGANAKIVKGTLRLGQLRTSSGSTLDTVNNYVAKNVVIRNISFEDSFDMFPVWDPKDSFTITASELGTGNCSATNVSATVNPNGCPSRRGGRWNSEYDNIAIENSDGVWLDHNTFSDGASIDKLYPGPFAAPYNESTQKIQHHDGAVDFTVGANNVTLSYNHFKNHDKTNLIGGSDTASAATGYGPGKLQITFHHNYWQNTTQRMPRVRFGKIHLYNNYYDLTMVSGADYPLGTEAWTLGTAGKIFAESNVFTIANGATAVAANKIAGSAYSSSTSNKTKCTSAGFSAADCGTYFYETNTQLNGAIVNVNTEVQTRAASSSSNAPLTLLDPASASTYWLPSRNYSYLPQDNAAATTEVTTKAGVGKL